MKDYYYKEGQEVKKRRKEYFWKKSYQKFLKRRNIMEKAIKILQEELDELKYYYELHWTIYDIDQENFKDMERELMEIRMFEHAIELIKEKEKQCR